MKRTTLKATITSALLASLLLNSCGTASGSSDTTASGGADSSDSVETTAKPEYVYPELNLDGKTIDILNSDSFWGIYIHLDHESMTGETLDDAVYSRNRYVEEKLGFKLKVTEFASGESGFDKVTAHAKSLILAGDDTYEAMYLRPYSALDLVTGGGFCDLAALPELQLDKEWYDDVVVKSATINDKLYFVSSSLNLMPFDCAWCLYFNEDLFDDYSIEYPYDLVREGKWTIDKLHELSSANANLNGDESWRFSANGKSVYGVSAHTNTPQAMLFALGVRHAKPSGESFEFSLTGERFFEATEKLSKLFTTEGAYFKANSGGDYNSGNYTEVFMANRALFLSAQVKTSSQMRDMDSTFGILPYPKLDESQEKYYAYVTNNNLMMTIPVTNASPNETAAVIDALTYRSYETVIPVYYENTVAQKGLRNDESIEMLDFIRQGRGIDIADYFGWNSDITNQLVATLNDGSGTAASISESGRSTVEAKIADFMKQTK